MRSARIFLIAAALSVSSLSFAQDAPSSAPRNPHGSGDPTEPSLQAAQDIVDEDPSLPTGTISVEIRDPQERPRPKVAVRLGIVRNSVAKGEARSEQNGVTDDLGRVRFDKLEGGSQMAYRVSVGESGAQFAAPPFNLDPAKGTRVVLHTYPVITDISRALVVMQDIVYVELKDDRVQVQQALNVFNFGKTAWVPKDVVMTLPTGFSALNGVQQMNDQNVDAVEGVGAQLKGTFPPGRHTVEYRWQAPYGGESSIDLQIGSPPNLAAARVMIVASQDMKVAVDGFPPPRPGRDGQGNAILETERELRREDAPMKTLRITLHDIPGPGPARYYATGLAALGVALGIGLTWSQRRTKRSTKAERTQERAGILAELEELERAKRDGEIGPRTYENARRELIDALARVLAAEAATKSSKAVAGAPTTA